MQPYLVIWVPGGTLGRLGLLFAVIFSLAREGSYCWTMVPQQFVPLVGVGVRVGWGGGRGGGGWGMGGSVQSYQALCEYCSTSMFSSMATAHNVWPQCVCRVQDLGWFPGFPNGVLEVNHLSWEKFSLDGGVLIILCIDLLWRSSSHSVIVSFPLGWGIFRWDVCFQSAATQNFCWLWGLVVNWHWLQNQ